MAKIIGNTTATPNPQPNWTQTDMTKADFIKNKPKVLTETDVRNLITGVSGFSGDYNDLVNKPSILTEDDVKQLISENIPETQVQSNWTQTDTTKVDYIKNKPTLGSLVAKSKVAYADLASDVTTILSKANNPDNVLKYTAQTLTEAQKAQARSNIGAGASGFSGDYNDLTNKPTILTEDDVRQLITDNVSVDQIPSDWLQDDEEAKDFIKNKPTIGVLASKDEVARTDLAEDVQASLRKADNTEDVLRYTTQTLTEEQKAQARANIGVGESGDGLKKTIVTSLPATPDENTIYLLKNTELISIAISHTEKHNGNLSAAAGDYLSGFGENSEADCLFYPIVVGRKYIIPNGYIPSGAYNVGFVVNSLSQDDGYSDLCIQVLETETEFIAPEGSNGLWLHVNKNTTPVIQENVTSDFYDEYMVINGGYELISSIHRVQELEKNIGDINAALAAYPIDSIYMSVNSTDPSVLFGGVWEQLETSDAFQSLTVYMWKRTA